MPPGTHQLVYASGATVSAPFVVESDGSVTVPPESVALMSASVNRLTVTGLPMVVDTRGLDITTHYVNGVTTGAAPGEFTFQVLPGRYRITYTSGAVIVAYFDLSPNGDVSVPPEYQAGVTTSGNRVTFVGLPMTVDTSGLSATQHYVVGVTSWTQVGTSTYQVLPGRYRLVYASGAAILVEWELQSNGDILIPPGVCNGCGVGIFEPDHRIRSADRRRYVCLDGQADVHPGCRWLAGT